MAGLKSPRWPAGRKGLRLLAAPSLFQTFRRSGNELLNKYVTKRRMQSAARGAAPAGQRCVCRRENVTALGKTPDNTRDVSEAWVGGRGGGDRPRGAARGSESGRQGAPRARTGDGGGASTAGAGREGPERERGDGSAGPARAVRAVWRWPDALGATARAEPAAWLACGLAGHSVSEPRPLSQRALGLGAVLCCESLRWPWSPETSCPGSLQWQEGGRGYVVCPGVTGSAPPHDRWSPGGQQCRPNRRKVRPPS